MEREREREIRGERERDPDSSVLTFLATNPGTLALKKKHNIKLYNII
jgi:hypothetical protein